MKEIMIKDIEKQISYYKHKLGKYDFSKTKEEYKARGFLEGTIFGLEQALINIKR